MKSTFRRLGNYIQLVDERNTGLKVKHLLGININKNFMPSVANVSETDLSKYKLIKKGQFAYSAMQVGRDKTVRVSLFTDEEPAIISPAYLVFEVIDSSVILAEFLMMWFKKPEFDRYGWFISDGSVRSSLEWERFCEIEIPIPDDIQEQKKFVDIYNCLLTNQKCYEKSLNDLQVSCDIFMESLVKKKETKVLGDYIRQIDERNSDLKDTNLLGININKNFMPSVVNKSGLDLSRYKIVSKGRFVCNLMHVGRDEGLPISLYSEDHPSIVSPAYTTFEVINLKELLPEFLMIFFKRAELDRFTWFISDSSIRGGLEWERFCEIEIPIPDNIEVQRSIVTVHHVLETRKRINEKLKKMTSIICPILIRGVITKLSMNLSIN